jgi:4-amino-4-deoxy-L-arabinose transferase-like glycosyltransferase/membrane-associated phospholipid phosphatase
MHWLLSLDIGLFHFINRSLGNPLFDWLMPILSGSGVSWFIPVAVALVIAILCFGNARARLCALLIFLVVALGDPLITNTVKHAVARPRPCITLPDVVERLGCTETGSMPSAHAANWFAVTMVAFLFYRRSAWFLLPMALAVSFSRVYNGVHYPSDVLAGAILGAGYAAAFALVTEMAWQYFGKKWFPLWHAKLPSLVPNLKIEKKEITPLAVHNSQFTIDQHWLRLGYALIFVTLVAHWIYLASGTIDLVKDEAYQWLWSKHLALSYYSKPPGIALIQFISTSIFGDTEFGVRFFSPLLAAILGVMLLRFLAREAGGRVAFWLLLIVAATPLLGVGTILMTIDPPLVLCWMWAVIAGWRAAQSDGKTRDWLVVGLAMGFGFLCKYTAAVQLVCWVTFFALAPAARIHLRKRGPWLALLIFLICTTPVLIWNAQHGWITVTHVAGDAGMHSQWQPTLRYFWDFLFTQALALNPIFFIGALWAMLGFWKFRRERPLWLFLFCMSAPLFFGYWLYSLHSRILPNWPVAAVLPMFCLMALYWNERRRIATPFMAVGIAFGLLAVTIMFQTSLIAKIVGRPLPGDKDPTHRIMGWRPTIAVVESAREKLAAEGKPAFIIADHYGITGLFTFYLPQAYDAALKEHRPLVYCVDSDAPENQFYFWPEYNYRDSRKGQNAIFVSDLDSYNLERGWVWKWLTGRQVNLADVPPPQPPPERMLREFETVTDLGVQEVKNKGHLIRRIHLWACYNLK